MKTINQVMEKQNLTLENTSPTSLSTRQTIPAQKVNRIFYRLSAIYGHKFKSTFSTPQEFEVAKVEWSEGLAGLSDEQIKTGLERCRLVSDWNPNIPEFIRYATGLPDVETVIHRVLAGVNQDVLSQLIRKTVGSWSLNNKTEYELRAQIKGLYADCYEQAINMLMEGHA